MHSGDFRGAVRRHARPTWTNVTGRARFVWINDTVNVPEYERRTGRRRGRPGAGTQAAVTGARLELELEARIV